MTLLTIEKKNFPSFIDKMMRGWKWLEFGSS